MHIAIGGQGRRRRTMAANAGRQGGGGGGGNNNQMSEHVEFTVKAEEDLYLTGSENTIRRE